MEQNTTSPTIDQSSTNIPTEPANAVPIQETPQSAPEPQWTESNGYYRGLPSHPYLLARSDDHVPWVDKGYKCNWGFWIDPKIGKEIGPVGDHPIVDAWNKGMSGRLVPDIVEALRGIQWDTVDVLRMDDPTCPGSIPQSTEEEELVLLGLIKVHVTVSANSMTSPEALRVAKECKAILVRHGIDDVEFEIKHYPNLVLEEELSTEEYSPPEIQGSGGVLLDQSSLSHRLQLAGLDSQFEDALGTEISFLLGDRQKGSKCLYLDLSRDDKPTTRVALTPRSVAVPNMPPFKTTEEFRRGTGKVDIPIIQPTDHYLYKWQRIYNDFTKQAHSRLDALNDTRKTRDLTCDEARHLAYWEKSLKEDTAELELISGFVNPATRIIAHTLYAPPMKPARSDLADVQSDWMRDWALLELHSEKHGRKLSELSNEGLPGDHGGKSRFAWGTTLDDAGFDQKPLATTPLRGVIPEAEIWKRQSQRGLLVGAFGANAGLIYGLSNNVKSLRRHVSSESEHILEDWSIFRLPFAEDLQRPYHRRFLNVRDAGACIFDAKTGRVGGMLTAAHVLDVAYVTPMERLLRDIRDSGFDVSIPAVTEEQEWRMEASREW